VSSSHHAISLERPLLTLTPQFSFQRNGSQTPSRSDSLNSSHNRHNAPSPTPPPNLNAQRRAPTPINTNSQPRSPIDLNPPPPPSAALTSNDVVIPNKSTMVVEEPSGSFNANPNTSSTSRSQSSLSPVSPPPTNQQPSSDSRDADELSPLQNQQPTFNFGSNKDEGNGNLQQGLERPTGQFRGFGAGGHQSRASEASSVGTSKFFGGYAGSTGLSEAGGRRSVSQFFPPLSFLIRVDSCLIRQNELPHWDNEERQALEKQRADYEYKLTLLQNRVQELERENEDAASALRGRTNDQERVRDLEGQLRSHQQRYEDQTGQLRMVQRDYDSLNQRHQQVQREQQNGSSLNVNGAGGDVTRLRQDLDAAEDLANELRGEVGSLVDELRMVNDRCEDLQVELDREKSEKAEKEREARDWKDKWQSAKTELRNIKGELSISMRLQDSFKLIEFLLFTATSQLFTSSINVERDYMPASSDGLINDTSIASFQTSIDDLLQAARSKEPSSVISHARLVVSAVEKIDQDVQAISPSRYNSLSLQDQDIVNSLKAKINATLSNLMTASKNHATSFGVSPVSLLDAAASHLAFTIVELVRILKIRRAKGPPSRSGSLDPTSATSSRFQREPMPSLPEDSTSYLPSSPPAQSRDQPPASLPAKANGYVSGGVSSLVSTGTAGMRNALEAMGIASSSASRSSLEKDRESINEPPRPHHQEEAIASPQSDYGMQHHQQQPPSFNSYQQQDSYGSSSSYRSPNEDHQQQSQFNHYDQGQPQQYRQDSFDGQSQQQYGENRYSGQMDGQQYGSPGIGGNERNVDELKVSEKNRTLFVGSRTDSLSIAQSYIENQTEAIVHSIQSLLSAIRSGSQGEQLNENLTQIITIVSSIVAISKDALPASHSREGDLILSDLTDHCDKLSEMQSETGGGQAFTKQTKQAMATASFGVAKSLKQLNGLFASAEQEEGLM